MFYTYVGSKRKRSIVVETAISQNDYKCLHDSSTPIPFDLENQLSIIKQARRYRRGTTRSTRYILFVLDTSGSITSAGFAEVIDVLQEFIPLFCSDEIKFAVMTFDNIMKEEICFKCNQGNEDKRDVLLAVKSIKFRSGPSTNTGTAAQCACSHMLSSPCGYRSTRRNRPSIDVLFFTDGQSNAGPAVCDAVKCFESFHNINVFTFGIGNSIRQSELDCIVGDLGDSQSVFSVDTFARLKELKESAVIEANGDICFNRP